MVNIACDLLLVSFIPVLAVTLKMNFLKPKKRILMLNIWDCSNHCHLFLSSPSFLTCVYCLVPSNVLLLHNRIQDAVSDLYIKGDIKIKISMIVLRIFFQGYSRKVYVWFLRPPRNSFTHSNLKDCYWILKTMKIILFITSLG